MSAVATILSPSSQLSHKRFSKRDGDVDDEDNISSSSGELSHLDHAQSKRFKGLNVVANLTESCFESPINMKRMLCSKRVLQNEARFQEPKHHAALSPISELSMSFTDTSLNGDLQKSLKKSKLTIEVFFTATLADNLTKSTRIVGGNVTTIDQVPYLVQLRDITGRFFCGGSLVFDTIVVTAAHCVDTTEQKHIVVVGGATTVDDDGVNSTIAKITMHPLFVRANFTYDIAVVKLDRPIRGPNIKTIPLCTGTVRPGEYLQVSGWGYISEATPGISHQVRTVRVPTFAVEECRRRYSKAEITESMMCASEPGVKDACTTDSGGAAVYHNELCGVVSWGIGCGRAEYPGVYTNITTVHSFIEQSINN